ncbi:MAG: hypothetical protein QOI10_623 [Solirubrobacterales bacterium]|nr:hypothetical protein [Solirubrobacterales bacterium]
MSGAASPAAPGPARRDRGAGLRALIGDPRLPESLFGFAVVVSGALLVALNSKLTFLIDDWEVLLHRRGFSVHAFFLDHAGHPSMSLVAVYKAIQATFGMDSLTPYAIAATLAFLASVVLLFVWLRRRVGDWLALAATLPVLFMGTAYEDLLSPFQLGYFAPMACGIGALLALERGDRRGDIACCGLLVFALTFQTLGLIFVAAALVTIGFDRELRSRAWIGAIPAVLYALWYLGWGSSDANQLSFDNVATSPGFIVDGYASSLSSLLGFAPGSGDEVAGSLDWGRPLLALLVVAASVQLATSRRVSKWLLAALTAGVAWWFLTAINASFFRAAISPRYQYVGAVLLLMAAAEVWRGRRASPVVIAIALVASLAATASNLATMRDRLHPLEASTALVRGDLAGLEIARDRVDPGLVLTPHNSGFNYFTLVDAGSYLSAADAFGSPAYSLAELATAPESARVAADKVLGAAYELALRPLPAVSGCQPPPGGAGVIELAPGETILRAPGPGTADLRLRRYAGESFPVALGRLAAGEAAALSLPADDSSEPWELEATGGPVDLCTAAHSPRR